MAKTCELGTEENAIKNYESTVRNTTGYGPFLCAEFKSNVNRKMATKHRGPISYYCGARQFQAHCNKRNNCAFALLDSVHPSKRV
jgi:hypothetical protein